MLSYVQRQQISPYEVFTHPLSDALVSLPRIRLCVRSLYLFPGRVHVLDTLFALYLVPNLGHQKQQRSTFPRLATVGRAARNPTRGRCLRTIDNRQRLVSGETGFASRRGYSGTERVRSKGRAMT